LSPPKPRGLQSQHGALREPSSWFPSWFEASYGKIIAMGLRIAFAAHARVVPGAIRATALMAGKAVIEKLRGN
jgi:hypothetical protein